MARLRDNPSTRRRKIVHLKLINEKSAAIICYKMYLCIGIDYVMQEYSGTKTYTSCIVKQQVDRIKVPLFPMQVAHVESLLHDGHISC